MAGLRLVAHYFDRDEAVIALGALDSSGLYAVIHGFDLIAMRPLYSFAFGGFRVMVVEEELELAVAVLRESQMKRLFEGERFSIEYHVASMLLLNLPTLLFAGFFWWLPLKSYAWHDVDNS